MAEVQHPFYPASLELPGFVPQMLSREYILSSFAAFALAVLVLTFVFTGRYKHVSTLERFILCWWMLTGLIHTIVEGYFVFTPDFYKLKTPVFLAELWKEYSKGDSRYAGRDPTVVLIEGITAVIEGPLCFYVIYAVLYRKACRHTLQIAICLGQLYGCLVYFGTVVLQGEDYSASGAIYFWFYFIIMNNIWVVVPTLIAGRAWIAINKAVDAATVVKRNKAS